MVSSRYVETKSRAYPALDGLRGIAAIVVMLFHIGTWVSIGSLFPRGYLAVDFFFCLSGFVVCSAYERKIASGMTFGSFSRIRLIRLLPLIVVGTWLGWLVYLVRSILLHQNELTIFEWTTIPLMNMFLLPYPVVTALGPSSFPLNVVAWSLFAEVVVNAFWFFIVPRLDSRLLTLILIISGAAILVAVLLGYTIDDQVSDVRFMGLGIFRAVFSFFIGVAVFRYRSRVIRTVPSLPAWIVFVVFIVSLGMPLEYGVSAYELLFISIISPTLLMLGLKTITGPVTDAIGSFGEKLSYPVYALHRPILLGILYATHAINLETYRLGFIVFGCGVVLVIATMAERLFDTPIRRRARNWFSARD